MTCPTVGTADWISQQPKSVQEAGEARSEELIRQVMLGKVGAMEMTFEVSAQDAILGLKGG